MDNDLEMVYLESYRAHVHRVVIEGYTIARDSCPEHATEDHITGEIVAAIESMLRDPRAPRRLSRIAVKESMPRSEGGRVGAARKKPDLIIELTVSKRPEYVFEAKRLCRPSFPLARYLGKDGLGMFLTGAYAARYGEAGMLGYVQGETPVAWRHRLLEKLDHARQIDNDEPGEKILSSHRREQRPVIDIFHFLLDFLPDES